MPSEPGTPRELTCVSVPNEAPAVGGAVVEQVLAAPEEEAMVAGWEDR